MGHDQSAGEMVFHWFTAFGPTLYAWLVCIARFKHVKYVGNLILKVHCYLGSEYYALFSLAKWELVGLAFVYVFLSLTSNINCIVTSWSYSRVFNWQ